MAGYGLILKSFTMAEYAPGIQNRSVFLKKVLCILNLNPVMVVILIHRVMYQKAER